LRGIYIDLKKTLNAVFNLAIVSGQITTAENQAVCIRGQNHVMISFDGGFKTEITWDWTSVYTHKVCPFHLSIIMF